MYKEPGIGLHYLARTNAEWIRPPSAGKRPRAIQVEGRGNLAVAPLKFAKREEGENSLSSSLFTFSWLFARARRQKELHWRWKIVFEAGTSWEQYSRDALPITFNYLTSGIFLQDATPFSCIARISALMCRLASFRWLQKCHLKLNNCMYRKAYNLQLY